MWRRTEWPAGRATAWLAAAGLVLPSAALSASSIEASTAGTEFFERRIRPLLAENCHACHGETKQKGRLRLDSPEAIRAGGEGGAILLPHDPEQSRMIQAVRHQLRDLEMPPDKRLSDRQIADLTAWVREGAPMPTNQAFAVRSPATTGLRITDEDRAHWAFQPVSRPTVPKGGNAIDALVEATLREQGITPNPPATPRELIRRASFDLIGLPPAPETVAAFERDPTPQHYERLIDRWLASPRYGERWGRHWLDLVRFAQSNGYERDGEKPLAWRYRDYVIKAFNEDKPYDRFVLEQIAGDELPDATADSVAATGFHRLGVWDDEPDDKLAAEYDALDDILSTTGTVFLGLTVGCARCHDHKFDPISQADYYSLLAFFRGVRPYESKPPSFDAPGFAPLAAPGEVRRWLGDQALKWEPIEAELALATDETEKKRLQKAIAALKQPDSFEWTLAVREAGPIPPPTHILVRGNPAVPGPQVEPGFPEILSDHRPECPPPPIHASSSGRRRVLAEWIASDTNPLTARVMVNRVWRQHFGQGLVGTPGDFGRAGAAPSHPRLLDWLAREFIDTGWSIKTLHKQIMMSATYQRSSRAGNTRASSVDPGNRLLWRHGLRRLEAEAVRDSILSISGALNPRMGGRGFFPHLGGEVLAGQSRPGLDWEVSSQAERSRRSVYAFVRRTMPIPLLEQFDYSNTTSPLTERAITTVAPQALMLLNDAFLGEQAAAFADRLVREAGQDSRRQVQRAYQLAMNREPTPREGEIAGAMLARQEEAFRALAHRLTFRLDVAHALATDYFAQLSPAHFLIGPRDGWIYHRGFWAPPYEGIRVVEPRQAPFALWQGATFMDGVLETRLLMSASSEFAGLLFRASAEGELSRGYEVVFDPRRQRMTLRRHGSEMVTVAEVSAGIPTGLAFTARVEATAGHFRVWLHDQDVPVLEVEDCQPLRVAGGIGVRTWGGAMHLEDMKLRMPTQDGPMELAVPAENPEPARRALESFCLLMLNLNEVLYVD